MLIRKDGYLIIIKLCLWIFMVTNHHHLTFNFYLIKLQNYSSYFYKNKYLKKTRILSGKEVHVEQGRTLNLTCLCLGARTRILSGKEVHVEQGRTLNLTCLCLGARTRILSGKEVHVEQGSTLNLTCVVHNAKTKPHYLLWFFKNQVVFICI